MDGAVSLGSPLGVQVQNVLSLPHVLEQNNAKLELQLSVMVAVVPLRALKEPL
jgi:hypothetical protein